MPDEIPVLVLSEEAFPEALVEGLRAVSPLLRVEARTAASPGELGPAVWDRVEVLYTTGPLPPAEAVPALRWIQSHAAGVDGTLRAAPWLRERVTLTTSSGIHTPAMAEYVLMMMLAHDHRLPTMLSEQGRQSWSKQRWAQYAPHELRGATVGIVGYGSIGRELARLARALGMRVLALKRHPERRADTGWRLPDTGDPEGDLPERIYSPRELPALLAESDYVALTAPLTPETHHLIDGPALHAMKRNAFLVNVGRGALVDEAALLQALRNGTIAGAALDVFEREPLAPVSPLWTAPNLIISPHISGFTHRYDERALALFAENLRRYVAGGPLLNRVDPEAGY